MNFANRVTRISGEGSDAWITHDRAVERMRRGEDVILLSIGDPDFDTPEPIRAAAIRALGAGHVRITLGCAEERLGVACARIAAFAGA